MSYDTGLFVLRGVPSMRCAHRAFTVATIVLAFTGCAEGNSYFLGEGEVEQFLTMARCEREAQSTYDDGSFVYSGYECRSKVLWITTNKTRYYEGQLVLTTE